LAIFHLKYDYVCPPIQPEPQQTGSLFTTYLLRHLQPSFASMPFSNLNSLFHTTIAPLGHRSSSLGRLSALPLRQFLPRRTPATISQTFSVLNMSIKLSPLACRDFVFLRAAPIFPFFSHDPAGLSLHSFHKGFGCLQMYQRASPGAACFSASTSVSLFFPPPIRRTPFFPFQTALGPDEFSCAHVLLKSVLFFLLRILCLQLFHPEIEPLELEGPPAPCLQCPR